MNTILQMEKMKIVILWYAQGHKLAELKFQFDFILSSKISL